MLFYIRTHFAPVDGFLSLQLPLLLPQQHKLTARQLKADKHTNSANTLLTADTSKSAPPVGAAEEQKHTHTHTRTHTHTHRKRKRDSSNDSIYGGFVSVKNWMWQKFSSIWSRFPATNSSRYSHLASDNTSLQPPQAKKRKTDMVVKGSGGNVPVLTKSTKSTNRNQSQVTQSAARSGKRINSGIQNDDSNRNRMTLTNTHTHTHMHTHAHTHTTSLSSSSSSSKANTNNSNTNTNTNDSHEHATTTTKRFRPKRWRQQSQFGPQGSHNIM